MREEIRLGNEALEHGDLKTAIRYFEQLLADGGTPLQERIATNRLRDIQQTQEARHKPSPPQAQKRRKHATAVAKPDAIRRRKFVRPPEKPLITIKKY